MDGVTFTGDVSIMTKLMSISSWVLERSSEEDLQLQTKETAEGFRVASRGLLAIPGRDGADICRAVYYMEFEMQASIFSIAAHVTFICFCDAFWRSTFRVQNVSSFLLKRCHAHDTLFPCHGKCTTTYFTLLTGFFHSRFTFIVIL